jgi:microcystin-dependent protein
MYKANVNPDSQMAFQALAPAGSSLPHNNIQPSLVVNFCIAMQGVFPARP